MIFQMRVADGWVYTWEHYV